MWQAIPTIFHIKCLENVYVQLVPHATRRNLSQVQKLKEVRKIQTVLDFCINITKLEVN